MRSNSMHVFLPLVPKWAQKKACKKEVGQLKQNIQFREKVENISLLLFMNVRCVYIWGKIIFDSFKTQTPFDLINR